MLPKKHLILGAIFSIILFILFPKIGFLGFFLILFSSVLIDVDHYIYYIYKKRDFNISNSYKWYSKPIKKWNNLSQEKRKEFYSGIFLFHGLEIIIILLFLIFYFNFFIYILIGFLFHQILDFIDLIYKQASLYKIISVFYSLIYCKNKKLLQENE